MATDLTVTTGAPARRVRYPMRWAALAVGVVALALGGLLATRFGLDPSFVRSPLIGKPVPEFDLPGLDGGRVRAADYRGRPYVVNFWASWCVPCRREAPVLRAFDERWAPEVAVVGILFNDTEGEARTFRDEFGLDYSHALDPDGRTAIDFGVAGVPETFVVDARGIVMAKIVGAVAPGQLDQVLEAVLAGETYLDENGDYRRAP